jgi:hypothetical protein
MAAPGVECNRSGTGAPLRRRVDARDGARLLCPGAAEIVGWMIGETEEKRGFDAGDVDVGVVGRVVGQGEVALVRRPAEVHVARGVATLRLVCEQR